MTTFLPGTARILLNRLHDGKGTVYAPALIQLALRDSKVTVEQLGTTQEKLEELFRQAHQRIAWHWLEGLHRLYDLGNKHMFGEVHDMLMLHLALGRASLHEHGDGNDTAGDIAKIMRTASPPKTRATYLERAEEGRDLLRSDKLDGYYLMASSLLLGGLQPRDIGVSEEEIETWHFRALTA